MRILVVGSGGREHALCYAFSKSLKVEKIFCANGNAGIAEVAECVAIKPEDIAALAEFAELEKIDLTFPGGETSLALGIVDEFEKRGLKIVGASKAAAQLESSKAFAKDFMARHGVPTARYINAHSAAFAALELESGDLGDASTPVVVKADGLAAGKGVVVAKNRADALAAINDLASIVGADAAEKIVLEECLVGKEVSLLMFADGENFALMPPVRDHKRIGESDTGPNTGGMGTITDASLLTDEQTKTIIDTIIRPTLRGCVREEFPFRGIMFLGLMLTADGPKVLEYNVRFGDPETQAILVRLKTDLVDICEAMLAGRLADMKIEWEPGCTACVVLASAGYPLKPRTGDIIHGLDAARKKENVVIFHSGTARNSTGEYVTAGGRVLGVTAKGDDLFGALKNAYGAVGEINWEGMQYRRDIGQK
ncbi:MAG TPA: phosphoribosylamine--glycine ligase [Pyrinomonadaceae bacterium]|jgi:phosphoribosylamine--glycine ligase|nr:phosphoribosylamine--glycine ligase [Pyrinomonadaceae bacterium]